MADLAALKTRIAFEINKTDQTTAIASAISDAIAYCRSERFEFNEQIATFNTVDGQQAYTTSSIPTDIGQLDLVQITDTSTEKLDPISYEELKRRTTLTTLKGTPTVFAWYSQRIYLYPIPDAIYTVTVSYQQRKAAPANDADGTTVWTNQAEPLIRAMAKKFLYRDVLKDADGYATAEVAEKEALAVLKAESLQLQDDGSGMAGNW